MAIDPSRPPGFGVARLTPNWIATTTIVERVNVWGGKIDPKFDCHYFDPTCAAGGSQNVEAERTAILDTFQEFDSFQLPCFAALTIMAFARRAISRAASMAAASSVRSTGAAAGVAQLRPASTSTGIRVEADTMGKLEVPADKYWGAQTQRSLINFPIGNETDRMPKEVMRCECACYPHHAQCTSFILHTQIMMCAP